MNKVTIIVPTYNVEAYIDKCLKSLVNQTYDKYEVLVINDGSPANEQVIIDEYVKNYPFVHSMIKKNGGYGSVITEALKLIETPYLLICDPDDYLYPHTVQILVNLMLDKQADMVIGAKTLVYADDSEESYDKSYNDTYAALIDKHTYLRSTKEYDQLFFVEPSPHAKLYKTEYVKKLIFPNKVSYTDNILYFMSLIQTNKVVYTSEPLAYYLINRIGNTRTDVKLQVINSWITVFTSILQQAKAYDDIPGIFYYRMFEGYKHVINDKIDNVVATDEEFNQKLLELYRIIELLLPHRKIVMEYYKQYADYRFLQRINDHLLFRPFLSKFIYQRLTKRKNNRRNIK